MRKLLIACQSIYQRRMSAHKITCRMQDDRVPAGAIVVAANEKTPFLVHDGINYTPLPAFAAGKL